LEKGEVMNVQETITLAKNKSASVFNGLLYFGCREVSSARSSCTFSISSLGQDDVDLDLDVGKTAKYNLSGIGCFSIRFDSIFGTVEDQAVISVTLLDIVPNAKSQKSSLENNPFTEAEVSNLKLLLNNLKSDIAKKYSPTTEVKQKVDSRINVVSDDLDKACRVDWSRLFVSTMIGVSIDLGFSNNFPEFLAAVMKRILETVAQISAEYLISNAPKQLGNK
jgi:hypothetical protein